MTPSILPDAGQTARNTTRIFLVLMWATALFSLCIAHGVANLSTDDATRLVQVRDLLAGQSWFDVTQYRLDPPAGVAMHWSRLVDLPLAILIKAASFVLPTAMAEQVALVVWPAALLFVMLAGIARLAKELAGDTAARLALALAVLMAPVLQNFRFGALHHHSIQLAVVVWALFFFMRIAARPRDAACAGLLCALSVAIGQEMVPTIATLAAVAATRWIVEGERYRRPAVAFATSLAAGTVVLAAATIAPSQYLAVHCDAISIAQVGTLVLGGFGLAALASLPPLHTIGRRLIAAASLGALLLAFIAWGAPQCLGDPYAHLDPRLADLWLSSVAEARSIASIWRDQPQQIPAYFGIPLAALVFGAVRCVKENGQRRWAWIAGTATQAAFALLSIWQLRGATGSNALGAVLVPAALLVMWPASESRVSHFGIARTALIGVLFLNPVALLAIGNGIARAVAPSAAASHRVLVSGEAGTCQRATDYRPLAGLATGRVLAFIDSGPFILMESKHAVFAAPYHRNQAGNIAMFDMFLSAPDDARKIMAGHEIRYVAFCPGAPERYDYARIAPQGLAAALADKRVPDFLEKIPFAGTDLDVYRVRR